MADLKILHTADLHIGASKHILFDGAIERQHQMLQEIKRLALKYSVDVVVVAGDAFHRSNPTEEEKNMFLGWVLDMDSLGVILIIESGNHDFKDHSGYTTLRYLSILYKRKKFKNTHIVELNPKLVNVKGYYFACIPWSCDFNKMVRKYWKKCKGKEDLKGYIPVGHGYVRGLKTDTGYVARGELDPIDYDFVTVYLFGDVHKRQEFCDGKGLMCGSPIQHDWGDKLPKTVTLLDLKKSKVIKKSYKKLKGIKPFVVTSDVNSIPKDAVVKLTSMKDLDKVDLPDNVVDVSDSAEDTDVIENISSFSITEGLAEFMAKKGFKPKDQKRAITLVEKLQANVDSKGKS